MSDDLIRYDLMVQEALRGVVRKVLAAAARDGLPGGHYFHVEFLTAAPGVRLSDRMRERFPERMTIILQHHFWDLEVSEEAMEVGLSFGGVAERVRVPFAAVTGFFDESVQFGLRFEIDDGKAPLAALREAQEAEDEEEDEESAPTQIAEVAKAPARDAKAAARDAKGSASDAKGSASDGGEPADEERDEEHPEGGAKVLSFNAFRKKT
jgi:hypothetical protein